MSRVVKRAAIYIRVSTMDQNTDAQESELREYVEKRGWSYKVYKDRGHSGAKDDRPALNDLVHDLRCRKIDVIVISALDRLARSLKQLLTIADYCHSVGADLIALKQNVDTTLPAGRLTFQVLGAVSEFERELLRERVRSGMAQAKRSGRHVGRPPLRKFHAADIDRMRHLRVMGTSIRKLAADFKISQWMAAKLTSGNAATGSTC